MDVSVLNEQNIERRCILLRPNGDIEEVKVNVANKEAVRELIGRDAEYKGEMEGKGVGILGAKEEEGLEEIELGFVLNPPHDHIHGVLLAFMIGENNQPIDMTVSQYRRCKKALRKNQSEKKAKPEKDDNDTEKEGEKPQEVYIEGLPYETKEDEVRALFSPCGDIEEIRLPKYQDSGRCRGYGFIRFSSSSSVPLALKKDGEHIGARYVKVTVPNAPTAVSAEETVIPADCRSIFVKNIPYDITEEVLKTSFMVFGKISNIRIPRWNDTGRQKGICYVDFFNSQSVKQAMKQNGKFEIGGRKVRIDVETGMPKKSFRTNEGTLWRKENKNYVKKEKATKK